MSGAILAAVALAAALSALLPAPRAALIAGLSPNRGRPVVPAALAGWLARSRRLRWRLGLLVGCAGWLVGRQPPVAPVLAAGGAMAAMALVRWLEGEPGRREQQMLTAQLPGCLDLLAPALAAGVPLRAAVRQVCALAPEPSAALLRGVLGHLDIGRSDAQAWAGLHDHPVWGMIARDLARCAESGTAVALILEVHATEARARARAHREAAARTVGVRSVLPLVCCFLPAFVLVGVVPIVAATIGAVLNR